MRVLTPPHRPARLTSVVAIGWTVPVSSVDPVGGLGPGRREDSGVKLDLNRFRRSGYFIAGALLLVLGSGPLLVSIALTTLGMTKDPNPNPVGFGMLAVMTFWPGIALMLVGLARNVRRKT